MIEQAQRSSDEHTQKLQASRDDNLRFKKAAESKRKLMEENMAKLTEKYERLKKDYETLQNKLSTVQQSGSPEKEHSEPGEKIQSIRFQLDSESIVELYKKIFTNLWPDALKEGKQLYNTTDDKIVPQKLLKILDSA
ncbi:uncharacterized protein LOC127872358 [Dreissena polymorpha]|uniref:uncharacterized protein LOC127872358 n=1 Tax=Dreissena polymorpha TaxID=45954 RepID=UPI0022648A1F|nr:uncharacterized protein LOC127872358 [Dreissena polymorpha]